MEEIKLFEIEDGVWNKVARYFHKTEKSLNDDAKALKEWIIAQRHLPDIMNDNSIKNFLICNKYSIERTKLKIDMYYTVRSQMHDIYKFINPKLPNIQLILDTIYFSMLPQLTKDMYRVGCCKIRDKNLLDQLDPYDVLRMVLNVQEIRIQEDVMFGDIFIFDGSDAEFNLVFKLTPTFFYKCISIYQNVFSSRLKAIYLINCPSFCDKILAIAKTLLKPKLFERIHICHDVKMLNQFLSKDILPKDYGGEEKSLEELQELLKLKLRKYEDHFDRLDQLQVNECLRPEELKNDEVLGFYGNFKKLDID